MGDTPARSHPSPLRSLLRPFAAPHRPQISSTESGCAGTPTAAECPEPLCPTSFPVGATSGVASEGVTPPSSLLRAHAPDLVPLGAFELARQPRVFAGCRQSLLGPGPSRHCLCNPCVGAWTLTPPSPSGACPVLPQGPRPRVTVTTLGGQKYPCHATSTGNRISGRQSFASLQAPTLARAPDCADRNTSRCWAAGPFTPRIAWPVTRSRMWHRYMSVLGD